MSDLSIPAEFIKAGRVAAEVRESMKKKSLMGSFISGKTLKAYWVVQRDRHQKILKASGAIK